MSGASAEDMELLNIEDEQYVITGTNEQDRLSDDNLDVDDDTPMLQRKDEEKTKEAIRKKARVWHMAYYQVWFDLTTERAISRLQRSLSPWSNEKFYSLTNEEPDLYCQPDLYCPFWITATLAFELVVISNVARYFESAGNAKDNWRSDVVELSRTSSILAGFCIIFPLILYVLLIQSGDPRKFVEVLSIYGYSLTAFLPGTLLLVIPSMVCRWIVFLLSTVFSIGFLVRNLWLTGVAGWSSPRSSNGIPTLVVIMLAPILLVLVIKFYYFNSIG